MNTKSLLEAIITNALPMVGIFWLLKRPFVCKWLAKIQPFVEQELGIALGALKRYIAIALSVIISIGLYYIYAALGGASYPGSMEEFLNLVLWLGGINFTGTQILHATTKKRKYAS